jgi:hypothetical protein
MGLIKIKTNFIDPTKVTRWFYTIDHDRWSVQARAELDTGTVIVLKTWMVDGNNGYPDATSQQKQMNAAREWLTELLDAQHIDTEEK